MSEEKRPRSRARRLSFTGDNAMSSDAELEVSLSIEAQFPQHFRMELQQA